MLISFHLRCHKFIFAHNIVELVEVALVLKSHWYALTFPKCNTCITNDQKLIVMHEFQASTATTTTVFFLHLKLPLLMKHLFRISDFCHYLGNEILPIVNCQKRKKSERKSIHHTHFTKCPCAQKYHCSNQHPSLLQSSVTKFNSFLCKKCHINVMECNKRNASLNQVTDTFSSVTLVCIK